MVRLTDDERQFEEAKLRGMLSASITRAQMLKAAGAAGLALASVPAIASADTGSVAGTGRAAFTQYPFFPQVSGTYTTEAIQNIINVAVTAEYLAVTVLTAAVNSASTLGFNPLILQTVQAALAEEYYHLSFLRDGAGAQPLTTTFTVPDPKILTDYTTFFETLEVAENIFVAAYMTATREFAELGQPTLAKYAYQVGATEAEHRVLVRAALAIAGTDHTPPNNKGFETDLLLYVRDAAAILTQLGFIGGTGTSVMYPGDAAAKAAFAPVAASVIQTTPNSATSTVTVTGPGDLTGARM